MLQARIKRSAAIMTERLGNNDFSAYNLLYNKRCHFNVLDHVVLRLEWKHFEFLCYLLRLICKSKRTYRAVYTMSTYVIAFRDNTCATNLFIVWASYLSCQYCLFRLLCKHNENTSSYLCRLLRLLCRDNGNTSRLLCKANGNISSSLYCLLC